MSWFLLAIISYLMLALVNLGDKFVVDKLLKSGKAYAFSVGVLGSLVFLAAPWFLEWPGIPLLTINFLAGAFFVFALWLMYESLRNSEMSRVVVVIGGIVPIFTAIFSFLFFKEKLSLNQSIGFLFLVFGMFIISFLVSKKRRWGIFWGRIKMIFQGSYKKRWVFLAIASAFFYSLFFISTKYAYNYQSFLSSFLWIKLGGLLVSLLFLLDTKSRKEIISSFKRKKRSSAGPKKSFIIFNQGLGALASIIQSYAVFLGPVAIINALQGVQYAFLLILGIIFSIFFPKILKEDISPKVLTKKIIAILFIIIGIYFIAI